MEQTIAVLFGKEQISEYNEAENKKQFLRKQQTSGNLTIKKFGTSLECDAYMKGLQDGEGWMDVWTIDDKDELTALIPSRVYVVREHFFQKGERDENKFAIFAGIGSYDRAMKWLSDAVNSGDEWTKFMESDEDYKERNLFFEIDEQVLEMWSAESIELLTSVSELGNYAEKTGELEYEEKEVDFGVSMYSFTTE